MRFLFLQESAAYKHAGNIRNSYHLIKAQEYSGIDLRRVIIDERAPLYFVGLEESYAPVLFLVADNDMENRDDAAICQFPYFITQGRIDVYGLSFLQIYKYICIKYVRQHITSRFQRSSLNRL